jgi:hypothetical protein
MTRTAFDRVGSVITLLLALGMTALTGLLAVAHGFVPLLEPLFWLLIIAPTGAAWIAFAAWKRRRWLVAAGMFVLVLPYWILAMLLPPTLLTLILVAASLARAVIDCRAKRRVSRLAAVGR